MDTDTCNAIMSFRHCCIEKFGSLLEAWLCCLDKNQSGRVEMHEFNGQCKYLGYKGDPTKLFRLLQLETRSYITVDDFDGRVADAIRHDDYRSLLEPQRDMSDELMSDGAASEAKSSPRRGPLDMSFDERQDETFRRQIKKAKKLAKEKST